MPIEMKLFHYIFFIFLVSLIFSCSSPSADTRTLSEKRFKVVQSLISIGMDIDEATSILKKQGFQVGKKYMPTKNKDYYQINILLLDEIPVSATIAETTGTSSSVRTYAIVKAGLDNNIIAIE